jgi:hypothetical protein
MSVYGYENISALTTSYSTAVFLQICVQAACCTTVLHSTAILPYDCQHSIARPHVVGGG